MEKVNKISGWSAVVMLICAVVMPKLAPAFLMLLVVAVMVWILTECGLDK